MIDVFYDCRIEAKNCMELGVSPTAYILPEKKEHISSFNQKNLNFKLLWKELSKENNVCVKQIAAKIKHAKPNAV